MEVDEEFEISCLQLKVMMEFDGSRLGKGVFRAVS